MTSQDKAGIAYVIGITAVFLGVAAAMGAAQDAGPSVSAPTVSNTMESETMMEEKMKPLKSGWERATSVQDPGIGHESHQLAVLLAPSENVYSCLLYTSPSPRDS